MPYEIADCTRTVGLHRFVGAAKTQVKEKVRTVKIALTAMEVITAKDPKGSRSRLCSVRWRRADLILHALSGTVRGCRTYCESCTRGKAKRAMSKAVVKQGTATKTT